MTRRKYKVSRRGRKYVLVLSEEMLQKRQLHLRESLIIMPGRYGASFYNAGITSWLLRISRELQEGTPCDQLLARTGSLIAPPPVFFARPFHGRHPSQFVKVDKPYLSPLPDVGLIDEILALRSAVSRWLDERQAPNLIKSISLSDAPPDLASYCCYRRLRQAPAFPVDMSYQRTADDGSVLLWNSGLSLPRVHEADSLLPLAWSEIWYAYDFRIRLRVCPYCWTVFRVPPEAPEKHHCGSRECRKAYEAERHGGIDAYRAFETARHKRKSDRLRGRPPKHQHIEKRKLAEKIQACLRGMRGRLSPDEYKRLFDLVDEMVEAGASEEEIRKAAGLKVQWRNRLQE
jgi:hypothetical protein